MKLTKGTLKVIITDPRAIIENPKRLRAGGKIFMPPYVVLEQNQLGSCDFHYCFGVVGKSVRPRYNHTQFPHAGWTPTRFADVRAWLETTDELTLVTNYEDTNV